MTPDRSIDQSLQGYTFDSFIRNPCAEILLEDKETIARKAMQRALNTPFNRHDRRAMEAMRRKQEKAKAKADQRRLACYHELQSWKNQATSAGILTSELIDEVFRVMIQRLFKTDFKEPKAFKQALEKTINRMCME